MKMLQKLHCHLGCVVLCLTSACSVTTVNSPTVLSNKGTSNNAIIELNQRIEYAVNRGDMSVIFDHLDIAALTEQANEKMYALYGQPLITAEAMRKFADRLKSMFEEEMADQGRWRFVRVMTESADSGIHESLYRLTDKGGSMGYVRFHIQITNDGFIIKDIYRYHVGMGVAKTISHIYGYQKLITDVVKYRVYENEDKIKERYQQLVTAIKKYNAYAVQGDYPQLKATYNALPAEFKSDPLLLMTLVNHAKSQNDDEYLAVLSILNRYKTADYPHLELIYYYAKLYHYQDALDVITQYEALIGPESGLDVMRAEIYIQQNDYDNALFYAKKAIGLDAENISAYDLLYGAFLQLERFEDVVLILDIMESKFNYGYDRQTFEADPSYTKFVQSSAYKTWSEKLP